MTHSLISACGLLTLLVECYKDLSASSSQWPTLELNWKSGHQNWCMFTYGPYICD